MIQFWPLGPISPWTAFGSLALALLAVLMGSDSALAQAADQARYIDPKDVQLYPLPGDRAANIFGLLSFISVLTVVAVLGALGGYIRFLVDTADAGELTGAQLKWRRWQYVMAGPAAAIIVPVVLHFLGMIVAGVGIMTVILTGQGSTAIYWLLLIPFSVLAGVTGRDMVASMGRNFLPEPGKPSGETAAHA